MKKENVVYVICFLALFACGFMTSIIRRQNKYLDLGAKYLDSCNKECDVWSNKYFDAKRENYRIKDSCLQVIIKWELSHK